jgi:hypothetical protein
MLSDLKLQRLGNVRFINFRRQEDLISAPDKFKLDQDRRNIFTDRTRKNSNSDEHFWTLEKVNGEIF